MLSVNKKLSPQGWFEESCWPYQWKVSRQSCMTRNHVGLTSRWGSDLYMHGRSRRDDPFWPISLTWFLVTQLCLLTFTKSGQENFHGHKKYRYTVCSRGTKLAALKNGGLGCTPPSQMLGYLKRGVARASYHLLNGVIVMVLLYLTIYMVSIMPWAQCRWHK